MLDSLLSSAFDTTAGSKTVQDLLANDRPTVFISYPGDNTPVCTKQLCEYRDNWKRLSNLPVRWWGINAETIEQHTEFRDEKKFPFDLIADPSKTLLKALDLYGLLGTKRGVSIVAPDGNIIATTSTMPIWYQSTDSVIEFTTQYL